MINVFLGDVILFSICRRSVFAKLIDKINKILGISIVSSIGEKVSKCVICCNLFYSGLNNTNPVALRQGLNFPYCGSLRHHFLLFFSIFQVLMGGWFVNEYFPEVT